MNIKEALIRQMLTALESAEDELTSGWTEPASKRLTLLDVQPAIKKARRFLKIRKTSRRA